MQPERALPDPFPAQAAGHTPATDRAIGSRLPRLRSGGCYVSIDRPGLYVVAQTYTGCDTDREEALFFARMFASAPALLAQRDAVVSALREIRRILDDENRRMFTQIGDIRDEVDAALRQIEVARRG